jgi:lipoprotein-anchoring transpeptidase ErfK/SrfK
MRSLIRTMTGIALVVFCSGCQAPPVPSEIAESESQLSELQGAGAREIFTERYEIYVTMMTAARNQYYKVKGRLPLFRHYDKIRLAFHELLSMGSVMLEDIHSYKATQAQTVSGQIRILSQKTDVLNRLGLLLPNGRFVRYTIGKTGILIEEAGVLAAKERYTEAQAKIELSTRFVEETDRFIQFMLYRYDDPVNLEKWRLLARQAAADGSGKSPAVLINKLEQSLTIYRNGRAWRTFTISLGPNGLFDKRHAGDYATPEGRYRVVSKNPNSRFHKALLLDYPNAADSEAFVQAQKKGRIPPGVGIGGLIEIHGGGNDIRTDGCIALRNEDLDTLFDMLDTGSSVIVIGSQKSLKAVLDGK